MKLLTVLSYRASQYPQLFFPYCDRPSFTPIQNSSKITVLCVLIFKILDRGWGVAGDSYLKRKCMALRAKYFEMLCVAVMYLNCLRRNSGASTT